MADASATLLVFMISILWIAFLIWGAISTVIALRRTEGALEASQSANLVCGWEPEEPALGCAER